MKTVLLVVASMTSLLGCEPKDSVGLWKNSDFFQKVIHATQTKTTTQSTYHSYDEKGFSRCLGLFPNQSPPISNADNIPLCFSHFAVLYSPVTKKPIVTIERLNKNIQFPTLDDRTNDFHEEPRLPSEKSASLKDYIGTGYDRGHSVPAGDIPVSNGDYEPMSESFSLANVVPQAPTNNRKIWSSSVEEATRKYVRRAQGDVFVFTGSSGSLGTIGKNKITVPAYLWKLVYDQTGQRAWAYWIPNTNDAKVTGVISYQQLMSNIQQIDGVVINFQLPNGI